jgi:hypothetical protein
MTRQTATIAALASVAVAALALAIGSWFQLWRHLRTRRSARRVDRS